ncbi:MAG TPA: anthranilate synthase component I family protein [Thermoanaerobaculia bacterium]|nr:anthranilate synthase component I family protein [Thermoanaerobaculia bacterium]
MAASASFTGDGWRLGGTSEERIFLEGEEKKICAETVERLPNLLADLDAVASSGAPNLLAAGFFSYEAGVWLEGSTALVRRHDFLPFAEFFIFDTRRFGAPRNAPMLPPAPFTFEERASAQRSLSSAEWATRIAAIRDGIERGDVYQVNLSHRTRFSARVDPFALARELFARNPVPYAVTLAADDWAVVSNSPELFLDVDLRAGRVVTRPIKGTAARGATSEADAAAAARLLGSAKDRAENVMITDLLRNDLGRIAVPGGVSTTAIAELRTFAHLHHLESTVEARLAPGVRLSDVLRATLPGGSITGAPKRSALGFIRRLEPVARGAYAGAVGFVRGDGKAVFNVAIRTAIAGRDTVDYHAGGGIVWDSDAGAEWDETLTKSRELEAFLQPGSARG